MSECSQLTHPAFLAGELRPTLLSIEMLHGLPALEEKQQRGAVWICLMTFLGVFSGIAGISC